MDQPLHPASMIPSIESTTVVLPFGDFSDDLENNLGRANGNCYQRKPGIPNVHDGQIMVRLKKKRFIVIDYSIVPTPADLACASVISYINIPHGAGTQKCTAANCPKVGVPVCLFGMFFSGVTMLCMNMLQTHSYKLHVLLLFRRLGS
jgi:hypothetical protein